MHREVHRTASATLEAACRESRSKPRRRPLRCYVHLRTQALNTPCCGLSIKRRREPHHRSTKASSAHFLPAPRDLARTIHHTSRCPATPKTIKYDRANRALGASSRLWQPHDHPMSERKRESSPVQQSASNRQLLKRQHSAYLDLVTFSTLVLQALAYRGPVGALG